MALHDDPPHTSSGANSLLAGQRKWSVGIGIVVLVVALVGLGVSSLLDRTGFRPVLVTAIAVIGGAGIALWLIEE